MTKTQKHRTKLITITLSNRQSLKMNKQITLIYYCKDLNVFFFVVCLADLSDLIYDLIHLGKEAEKDETQKSEYLQLTKDHYVMILLDVFSGKFQLLTQFHCNYHGLSFNRIRVRNLKFATYLKFATC